MSCFETKTQNGFSLIELMVALGILGILTAIALPANKSLQDTYNKMQVISNFHSDIARVQAHALQTGNRAVLSIAESGTTYTYGLDVYPYNNDFAAESIELTRNLPNGISISSDDKIIFDARGYVINESELLVNRSINIIYDGSVYRNFTLYPTGVIE